MSAIIGINGPARAGKDTIANYIATSRGYVRVGFADEMKRFCQKVFDFSDEQIWGDKKEEPDFRYPRSARAIGEPHETEVWLRQMRERSEPKAWLREASAHFLTPRAALQTLGTEWGRFCYEDVWVDLGIRTAKLLIKDPWKRYNEKTGIYGAINTEADPVMETRTRGVVFSDVRFRNEMEAVRKADGYLIRVKRPGYDGGVGLSGHLSEREQKSVQDSEFDAIIENDGTLEELYEKIDKLMES